MLNNIRFQRFRYLQGRGRSTNRPPQRNAGNLLGNRTLSSVPVVMDQMSVIHSHLNWINWICPGKWTPLTMNEPRTPGTVHCSDRQNSWSKLGGGKTFLGGSFLVENLDWLVFYSNERIPRPRSVSTLYRRAFPPTNGAGVNLMDWCHDGRNLNKRINISITAVQLKRTLLENNMDIFEMGIMNILGIFGD